MAEDKDPNDANGAEPVIDVGQQPMAGPTGPGIRVVAQFVRDLSFENPRAPDSLQSPEPPKMEVDVELNARGRENQMFEVDLKLVVSAKREDGPAFHVELLYGGLFQISNVTEKDLEPVLLIECPRFLFPFARQIIAQVTAEGGFPPFRMDPIDFAGIFLARQAQLSQPTANA